MQDLTAAAGAAWTALAVPAPPPGPAEERFNPFHAPAGPGGGEFTSSGGAGGGAAAHTAHAAPRPGHGPHDAQKQHLLAEAGADRAKAHQLEAELKTLESQAAAAAKAAKSAHAAPVKGGAAAGPALARKHKQVHRHVHRHASLRKRISVLHHEIHTLLAEASALDAQAAKL